MNKRTKKRTNYNEEILIEIQGKYGYTIDYIRKALRGDRTGDMPDIIKETYEKLDKAAKAAIKTTANTLIPQ